jgi:Flp pilus assembly protein TadG
MMNTEVSRREKSRMQKLPNGAHRTSTGEIEWKRPLTLRQELRAFFGVREEGSQLVEMAVVAPLLLIILTGMASFGMALYSQQQIGYVTAGAVQALTIDVSQITDPCATVETYISSSLPSYSAASFTYTLKIYTSSTASVTSGPTTGTGFSCKSYATDITQFQPVILTVSYPYSWFPIFTWAKYGSSFKPSGSLTTTQAAMAQ